MIKLVIGNKNYSSWSLRPWLLLSAFNLDFEEIQESLLQDNIASRLGQYSPTNRVPVLIDDDVSVWDSLAICEYISEQYLDHRAWPSDKVLRAQARAVCAEMHAGFNGLRNELPMNCRATRTVVLSEAAKQDIKRMDDIWSASLSSNTSSESAWLFGEFSIADCFFAPVALRFKTYGIELSEAAKRYQQQLLRHPKLLQWLDAALTETEVVPEDEAGV